MKALKEGDVVPFKFRIGQIVNHRVIVNRWYGPNAFGRPAIMYAYRYDDEPKDALPLNCSEVTLLSINR